MNDLRHAMRDWKKSAGRLVFLPVLYCALLSCRNRSSNAPAATFLGRGAAENKQRQVLNLRQVKANWYPYKVQFGEEVWALGPPPSDEAKRIHRDPKGSPEWETDVYFTGRTFTTIDGVSDEFLQVLYDYKTSTVRLDYVGQNPTIIGLLAPLRNGPGTIASGMTASQPGMTTSEKLLLADRILKMWGMSRL